jgi:uncharacterized protein (DUF58 family)
LAVPEEILKKVKLLEVRTRRLVNNLFVGEYHSAFRGQGMTFAEFREYVPGDDVRSIAWSLMARSGKVYIKKHDEEREMTVILAVDVSGSQVFGSQKYLKGEAIAHLSALLGFAATLNKDAVGLLLFSDQVELFVPPKKGRGQMHRILREIYFFKPKSKRTSIGVAVDYLQGVLKKKSHVFLFSDFLDQGFETPLRLLGKKHDAVAVVVKDPLESKIPALGLVDFEDPETGEVVTVDTSSSSFQKEYKQYCQKQDEVRSAQLLRSQVDQIDIETDKDLVQPLVQFFQKRKTR